MKIFIGCDDIASVLSGLSEGFKDLGHQVTTFVFSKNKFYLDVEYDIVAPALLKSITQKQIPKPFNTAIHHLDQMVTKSILKANTDNWIKAHDLFIFIWRSWLEEEVLFKKIKKAGKKIICVHLGSDVRHISAYRQEFNEDVRLWEKFFHDEDLNAKIKKIRYHELYADTVYSVPDQAGLYIRPYHHIYLPISKTKKIKSYIPGREDPLIVHAPSRSGIKGTQIILNALEKLTKDGYRFTFRLLENLSNTELLNTLTSADILVDEILLHGPGVLSSEAMLSGCAVATKTLGTNKNIFNPPVLNISSDTIEHQLKFLLENFNYRILLAEKGIEYASTQNNPSIIAQNMLDNLSNVKADYIPTFFMKQYRLENGVTLTKKNRALSARSAAKYFEKSKESLSRAAQAGLI